MIKMRQKLKAWWSSFRFFSPSRFKVKHGYVTKARLVEYWEFTQLECQKCGSTRTVYRDSVDVVLKPDACSDCFYMEHKTGYP